jgi:hypothetical protein
MTVVDVVVIFTLYRVIGNCENVFDVKRASFLI